MQHPAGLEAPLSKGSTIERGVCDNNARLAAFFCRHVTKCDLDRLIFQDGASAAKGGSTTNCRSRIVAGQRNERGQPDASEDRQRFEEVHGALLSLSYRMLGTRSEAEDAVQDTFVHWQEADRTEIRNAAAWLTTTCTRRCIDLLRRAERQRLDYVGAWLPEPVHTPEMPEDECAMQLASSLSPALLLMLERLSPKERAAYLLHDIFELTYPRIADAGPQRTGLPQARFARTAQYRTRVEPPPLTHQEELLSAFRDAIETGDAVSFAEMLSEDIEIRHDSGGKVSAAIHILQGKQGVLAFVQDFLHRVWRKYKWTVVELNGARAVILENGGVIVTAVAFGFDENGFATNIYILRNPDKLASLSMASVETWAGRLA
jgi:RNA polymerase sigma factor (sigma-70 family)